MYIFSELEELKTVPTPEKVERMKDELRSVYYLEGSKARNS